MAVVDDAARRSRELKTRRCPPVLLQGGKAKSQSKAKAVPKAKQTPRATGKPERQKEGFRRLQAGQQWHTGRGATCPDGRDTWLREGLIVLDLAVLEDIPEAESTGKRKQGQGEGAHQAVEPSDPEAKAQGCPGLHQHRSLGQAVHRARRVESLC